MFQTTITTRNIEIDNKKVDDYLNKRLKGNLRLFKDVLNVHITLSKQRNQYSTEITVNGEGFNLHANGANSKDVYVSIEGALNKIEGQLKRLKEKRISKKRRQHLPLEAIESTILPNRDNV